MYLHDQDVSAVESLVSFDWLVVDEDCRYCDPVVIVIVLMGQEGAVVAAYK